VTCRLPTARAFSEPTLAKKFPLSTEQRGGHTEDLEVVAEAKILAPTRKLAASPAGSMTIKNELPRFTLLSFIIKLSV
jgi:hypothetical protein